MKRADLIKIEGFIESLLKSPHTINPSEVVNELNLVVDEIHKLRLLEMEKSDPSIVDGKFIFLALNPYTGNHYTQKDAFIMCAKDAAVPAALQTYVEQCENVGASVHQIEAAQKLLQRVIDYQKTHTTKIPDITSNQELMACCFNGEH